MKIFLRHLIGFILILQLLPTGSNAVKKWKTKCILRGENRIMEIVKSVAKLSYIQKSSCNWEPNIIRLFASRMVIMDVDLNLIGKGIQLAIMAPRWQIETDSERNTLRRINLSGGKGGNHTDKSAPNGSKDTYKNGFDGLAGLPGGPAGNFFGVVNTIMDGEITILADGGTGGAGQNGGNGADGDDGITFQDLKYDYCNRAPKGWEDYWRKSKRYSSSVHGTPGERGAAGGNGGIGGLGGTKGVIKILQLVPNNKNLVKTHAENGVVGQIGLSGHSGRSGFSGYIQFFLLCDYIGSGTFRPKKGRQKHIAGDPIEGKSNISLKFLRAVKKLPDQNMANTVNQYKMYLRRVLAISKLSRSKQRLLNFYNSLCTDENIAKLSDTLSLVEEFTNLEETHYLLHERVNFTFSYETLQKRINSYKEKPNKLGEDSQEYKSVLYDLNMDILSRQKELEEFHSNIKMNINVENELNSRLLPSVNKLRRLEKFNKFLLVVKLKLTPLESQIKDVQDIIGDKLKNALMVFDYTLNINLDSILDEIINLKNEIIKLKVKNKSPLMTLHERRAALRKLENNMSYIVNNKHILRFMTFAAKALSIIIPAMSLAAIENTFAQNLGDKIENIKVIQPYKISDSIKQLITSTKNNFENDCKQYRKIIMEQENFVFSAMENKSPEEVIAVKRVWDSTLKLRKQLCANNAINVGYNMIKLYTNQEVELAKELKELESANVAKESSKYLAYSIGLRVTKYLKATTTIFQTESELVKRIMQNETLVNELAEALIKNQVALKTLTEVEENIYFTSEKVLEDLNIRLNMLADNIDEGGEFRHDIKEWNVQEIINKIQTILTKIPSEFIEKNYLDWAFNDCKKQLDLLFELLKQLMEYKDENQDKIDTANINAGHTSNLHVSDFKLKCALSELQVNMASNALVERYHKLVFYLKNDYNHPNKEQVLRLLEDLGAIRNNSIIFIAQHITDNIIKNENDIFRLEN